MESLSEGAEYRVYTDVDFGDKQGCAVSNLSLKECEVLTEG